MLTDEQWRRVQALFEKASERPPDQRDAFLAEEGGEDARIWAEVASLLRQADEMTNDFLRPAKPPTSVRPAPPAT